MHTCSSKYVHTIVCITSNVHGYYILVERLGVIQQILELKKNYGGHLVLIVNHHHLKLLVNLSRILLHVYIYVCVCVCVCISALNVHVHVHVHVCV